MKYIISIDLCQHLYTSKTKHNFLFNLYYLGQTLEPLVLVT